MKPVVVGLHITKCAGTSLALAVRRALQPRQWYTCSEFTSNTDDSILEITERTQLDELRFVFGHYVHQSLLGLFQHREIILVTGIREPVSRMISEYFHINRIRHTQGKDPMSAKEFLKIRKNTMCEEVLRTFPAARSGKRTMAENAAKALKIFDLIYSSEDFEASTKPLVKLLNLPDQKLPVANTRKVDEESSAFLEEQVEELKNSAPLLFGEDLALYAQVKHQIGAWKRPKVAFQERWATAPNGTPNWLMPVLEDPNPMASLQAHHGKYRARNFISAGRRDDLVNLIAQRRAALTSLEESLGE